MGLFSENLNCPTRWQPLRRAGLSFLLLEDGSALESFIAKAQANTSASLQGAHNKVPSRRQGAEATSGSQKNLYASPKEEGVLGAKYTSASKSLANANNVSGDGLGSASGDGFGKKPIANPSSRVQLEGAAKHARPDARLDAGPDVKNNGTTISQWPAPWGEFWNKARQGRNFVWTYFELGNDLLYGNEERGSVLRKILAGYARARGESNFWPFSVPSAEGNQPTLQVEIFMQGIEALNPAVVFIFGEEAYKVLCPDRVFAPYTIAQFGLRVCVALPELCAHAEDATLASTITYLCNEIPVV